MKASFKTCSYDKAVEIQLRVLQESNDYNILNNNTLKRM